MSAAKFCGQCGLTRLLHSENSDHAFVVAPKRPALRIAIPDPDLAPPSSTPPQRPALELLNDAKSKRDTVRAAIVGELRRTPHNLTLAALLKADDEATEEFRTAVSAYFRT